MRRQGTRSGEGLDDGSDKGMKSGDRSKLSAL